MSILCAIGHHKEKHLHRDDYNGIFRIWCEKCGKIVMRGISE